MNPTNELEGMEPIARSGELILYADPEREAGILYNACTGRVSERQMLQIFFKWGHFVDLDTYQELPGEFHWEPPE